MIDVRIDTTDFATGLRRTVESLRVNSRKALADSVSLALRHARTTTSFKDRTGDLRRSIVSGHRGEWSYFIRAAAKHARFIEEGTKAHEIRPKLGAGFKGPARPSQGRQSRGGAKPFLVFRVNGHWVRTRLVRHKGTKATHFMQRAADEGAIALESMLTRAVRLAFG